MAAEATFLSTLPARGATFQALRLKEGEKISIHAPREGSDPRAPAHHAKAGLISIHAPREGSDAPKARVFSVTIYFYPRSPRGERRARS